MEIKLFSCEGISHNGRTFPKDVMEKAIEEFNKGNRPALITKESESNFPNLSDAVGTLEHISIKENGDVFGNIQLLPTPEGKVIEDMLLASKNLDEGTMHISPFGYGEVNENGEVTHMDITHFNIRF